MGDTVFNFGMHTGKTFQHVFDNDKWYVSWAAKQDSAGSIKCKNGLLKRFVDFCKSVKENISNGGGANDSLPSTPWSQQATQADYPLKPLAAAVAPNHATLPNQSMPAKQMMPPNQGAAPVTPHQGMMPNHGMMPQQGMMPQHQGMMPQHQGMMPQHQAMMPQHQGMMPPQGMMTQQGMLPNQGIMPHQGFMPGQGFQPSQQGFMPSQGFVPTQGGLVSQQMMAPYAPCVQKEPEKAQPKTDPNWSRVLDHLEERGIDFETVRDAHVDTRRDILKAVFYGDPILRAQAETMWLKLRREELNQERTTGRARSRSRGKKLRFTPCTISTSVAPSVSAGF